MSNVAAIDERRTASSALCKTPTYQVIWETLKYSLENMSMCAVIGASGVGKTSAALAFASTHDRVFFMRAKTQRNTSVRTMADVAEVLGLRSNHTETNIFLHVRRILEGGMLIVDEANRYSDPSLEFIRDLNDGIDGIRRFGVALIGNPIMITSRSGKNRHLHSQFLSRLRPTLVLEAALAEDYDAIFDYHKIVGAKSRAAIKKTAEVNGLLRTATFIIEDARKLAGNRMIELHHIEAAIERLGY